MLCTYGALTAVVLVLPQQDYVQAALDCDKRQEATRDQLHAAQLNACDICKCGQLSQMSVLYALNVELMVVS